MPTLVIEGKRVKVDDAFLSLTPEQQASTVDEIAGQLGIASKKGGNQDDNDLVRQIKGPPPKIHKEYYDGGPMLGSIIEGIPVVGPLITSGVHKAVAGITSGITDKTYDQALSDIERNREQQKEEHPAQDISGQLIGSIGSLGAVGSTALGARALGITGKSLLGRTAASGATNAALSGADTLARGGTVNDAIGSAELGGAIGAAIPVVGAVVSKVAQKPVQAVKNAIIGRTNPEQYATRKVLERVGGESGMRQAMNRMATNPGASLADVSGKSTKDLLRAAANVPGKAKDRAQALLTIRQFGQGDRLKTAISKTFANPEGYLAAKEQITADAKRIAAPLYEAAYAKPVHYAKELEGILNTPAGKAALRHAEVLAANEQVPFKQLFINVQANGSKTVKRVPDTRGWDYIKRAMDDMIDGQTDSITKKVTNEGRILIDLKNKMLRQIDFLNPDYAAARQAFAGQAKLDDALEMGRKVFSLSPEAMKREVAAMTGPEKAMARIGAAETLRGAVENAGVTQNSVLRIFSKPSQIKNLQALFETPEKFSEFRKTIFAEARKRATYDAVKGNSTTAAQLAELQDAGALKDGVQFLGEAAGGRPLNATWKWIAGRLSSLGGMTPEAADNIAKKLMSTDPTAAKAIFNEIGKISQAKINTEQKQRMIEAMITRAGLSMSAPTMVSD